MENKKKYISLRIKILVVIGALLAMPLLYFVSDYIRTISDQKVYIEEVKKRDAIIINSSMENEILHLNNVVRDYSLWGDMVDFVNKPDYDWAKAEVSTILLNYDLEFYAVVRPDCKIIYSNNDTIGKNSSLMSLFKNICTHKNKFGNFFSIINDQIYNISWSVITQPDDTARNNCNGYFVVAKLWDNKFLDDMGKRTGDYTILLNDNQKYKSKNPPLIVVYYPLKSMETNDKYVLKFIRDDNLNVSFHSGNTRILGIILFCALMLVIVGLSFTRFVLRPLKIMTISIKDKNIELLDKLLAGKNRIDEFYIFAGIIKDYFEKSQENIKIKKDLEKMNERLISSNLMKDKILKVIGHDLKNPFSAIIGFSELIINGQDDEELDKMQIAKIINEAANSGHNLLVRLLEFGLAQTGKKKIHYEVFLVNNTIKNTLALCSANAFQKNITFIVKIDNPIRIYADENMIETIFRNIITNAIKFSFGNSVIIIEAKEQVDEYVFSITDSGIGMPSNIYKNLFNLEENNIQKDVDGKLGTGIGLLMCKEFINKHNGNMWAVSEPGEGSIFYFSLPSKIPENIIGFILIIQRYVGFF